MGNYTIASLVINQWFRVKDEQMLRMLVDVRFQQDDVGNRYLVVNLLEDGALVLEELHQYTEVEPLSSVTLKVDQITSMPS